MFTRAGTIIYRTDLQGDVNFVSDGKKLSTETEKNASSFEVNEPLFERIDNIILKCYHLSIKEGTTGNGVLIKC